MTEYSYQNDRLSSVKAPDGVSTAYSYDSSGRLSSIEFPGSNTATSTISFTYDSSHRVTKVAQAPNFETRFAYSAGQTVVTDANGNSATYSIDADGRVTSTKDAINRTRSQTWTSNSDIQTATDALGTGITNYTYDASNNRTGAQLPTGAAASAVYAIGANCSAPNTGTAFQPKCSTDDAGNKKQYEYNSAGNLVKQTNTTSPTPTIEFERTYNSIAWQKECGGLTGQVCTTKDANGNVTSYAYSAAGDLLSVTPPAPLGKTSYTYDTLGRVVSVTDGNNVVTSYSYDIRDRLVKTTFANGQQLRSTWYTNGLEKTRTDTAGGGMTFEYDRQGRILKQSGPRTGLSQTYTYDNVGNLLTTVDASGTTTYTYDAANQLTRLRQPGGTCPTTGAPAPNSGCILFEYDANSVETKRTLPGGAVTTTARDASGRPTRITAKAAGGATAVDIGYSYTPSGGAGDRYNIQSRTAYAEQGITAGAVTSYTYDVRNRLTLASEKSGSSTTASWEYSYDGNGNRTRQIRTGSTGASPGTINYTYNAANQLTSSTGQTTTWTYDGAGNQTRNGAAGVSTSYGDRMQATQIGLVGQTVFGLGNTDRQAAGGTTFNSGPLGLVSRTSGGSTQVYTRAPNEQAVGYKAASQWYYVHDHLGSVVGLFSATGTYSGGYSYSPYGEARATATVAAVTANPLRYISGYHDGNGIYKLGARYYDSSLGRFTQMDPSGQEKNRYAYAACNPINASDPSGLFSAGCGWSIAGILYTTPSLINDFIATAGGIATAPTGVGFVWALAAGTKTAIDLTLFVISVVGAVEECIE